MERWWHKWPAAKIIGMTGSENLQVSMLAGDVFSISSHVIELAVHYVGYTYVDLFALQMKYYMCTNCVTRKYFR